MFGHLTHTQKESLWSRITRKTYHFVNIILGHCETIVQEKSGVAFRTIRVKNLLACLDFFGTFNEETIILVGVKPTCLLGNVMVQHIR